MVAKVKEITLVQKCRVRGQSVREVHLQIALYMGIAVSKGVLCEANWSS